MYIPDCICFRAVHDLDPFRRPCSTTGIRITSTQSSQVTSKAGFLQCFPFADLQQGSLLQCGRGQLRTSGNPRQFADARGSSSCNYFVPPASNQRRSHGRSPGFEQFVKRHPLAGSPSSATGQCHVSASRCGRRPVHQDDITLAPEMEQARITHTFRTLYGQPLTLKLQPQTASGLQLNLLPPKSSSIPHIPSNLHTSFRDQFDQKLCPFRKIPISTTGRFSLFRIQHDSFRAASESNLPSA